MLFFYRLITIFFYPFLIFYFFLRIFFKKENLDSFTQKIFFSKKIKNNSKIIWFHGASIGEVKSVFPLIKFYLENKSEFSILITSTTLSSKKIIQNEFSNNERIIHRFLPVDINFLTRRFLNNWNPDIIFFIDSEIWPNFISQIKTKKIPLIILNGRITEKTFMRWKKFKNFCNEIFESFDLCIASSEDSKKKFEMLGIKKVVHYGNLKFIFDKNSISKIKSSMNLKRKCWLASNTHEGEEELCLKVHDLIKIRYPDILTIIVPRHVSRAKKLQSHLKKINDNIEIISNQNFDNTKAEILIVDVFGILSKFYSNLKNVFIGKSMVKELSNEGGQNPLEAIQFGCKVYHGPYTYNFHEIYDFLKKNNMSKEISDSKDLANEIIHNFQNSSTEPSKDILKIGENILDKTLKEIDNFF